MFYEENIHYIVYALIALLIIFLSLLIYFLLKKNKSTDEEYCIVYKNNIEYTTSNFLEICQCSTSEFLAILKNYNLDKINTIFVQDKLINLNILKVKNKYKISIYKVNIFESFPLPILYNGQSNNLYTEMLNAEKILNIPLSGNYYLFQDILYKKESFKNQCQIYLPISNYIEARELIDKSAYGYIFEKMPILLLISDRDGMILNQTDAMKEFIGTTVGRVIDFFQVLRGKLELESISFQEKKTFLLNCIKTSEKPYTDIIISINTNKIYQMIISPMDNIVYVYYIDISDIYNTIDINRYIKELPKIFNDLSDFIIMGNEKFECTYSNFQAINLPMSLNKAQNILKSFSRSDKDYKEKIINDITICILNRSINEKIKRVQENIDNIFIQIKNYFNILAKQYNSSIAEYAPLTQYYLMYINNNLDLIRIASLKQYEYEIFDLLELIEICRKNFEQVLIIRKFSLNIQECNFNINSHKESINLIIKHLFLLAFEYPNYEKKLSISSADNKISVLLSGIPKEYNISQFSALEILNNYNIKSYIHLDNILEIGFIVSI